MLANAEPMGTCRTLSATALHRGHASDDSSQANPATTPDWDAASAWAACTALLASVQAIRFALDSFASVNTT